MKNYYTYAICLCAGITGCVSPASMTVTNEGPFKVSYTCFDWAHKHRKTLKIGQKNEMYSPAGISCYITALEHSGGVKYTRKSSLEDLRDSISIKQQSEDGGEVIKPGDAYFGVVTGKNVDISLISAS